MSRFHPEAQNELFEAQEEYERQRPGRGERFSNAVEQICKLIDGQPELFAKIDGRRRIAPVDRFPYGVVYEITSFGVVVIAIAHLRRRPGYWRVRSSDNAESESR